MTDATPDAGHSAAARFQSFPWAIGLGAGAGSFLAGYAVLIVFLLVGIAEIPGSIADRLVRLGFVHYNAHGILIVGETPPDVAAPATSLLTNAAAPVVYYAVPVAALLGASVAFTRWRRPDRRDGVAAIATGLSMTLGYLLLALVGTYVFTRTQTATFTDAETVTALFRPSRLATLVFGTVYPLVLGTAGSLGAQLWFVDE